jgi:DNA-binding XRE family transcriptional regulator
MKTKTPIKLNLKTIREAAHLSQSDLARTLKVSREVISSYEKGKYEGVFRLAYNLCRTLQCDITDLAPSGVSLRQLGAILEQRFITLSEGGQATFAHDVGISKLTLKAYFAGRSSGLNKVLRARDICAALDCTIWELINE